jgi:predicted nucleic acid-binding protein
MIGGRSFVDTNVLVYCHDRGEPAKREKALALLASSERDLVVSTQVLQEFYVTVVRKLEKPLGQASAEAAVRDLAQLPVVTVDPPMVLAAIATSRAHQLSLWDALILQAAIAGGCHEVLTEDLQDGFQLGPVIVTNPFG